MRALLVVLVAGCVVQGTPRSGDPGWSFPGDTGRDPCQSDGDCAGGDVCARDGGCWAPSEVRAVHVTWMLGGMPASTTTCASAVDLQIGFYAPGSNASELGYAPVPCVQGKFSVDKLPVAYTRVRLGRASSDHGWESAAFDGATGEATLDLPF